MLDRRLKLLVDAIGAMDAAMSFVAGKDLPHYEADLMLRSAVERQLEILGEACSRLAKEHASLFDEIPPSRLAVGLRNRIIHGYDAVDDETVFTTVRDDLPALHAAMSAWLDRLRPSA
ncbi:DUF86 domain-containing protein [Aquabacterium sp.]|uniref:HepT-like ribonuclease domain-containing protein n=1 Tax=Aquabacterium sp. TaxID=1872578 RepID=UPI00378343AC